MLFFFYRIRNPCVSEPSKSGCGPPGGPTFEYLFFTGCMVREKMFILNSWDITSKNDFINQVRDVHENKYREQMRHLELNKTIKSYKIIFSNNKNYEKYCKFISFDLISVCQSVYEAEMIRRLKFLMTLIESDKGNMFLAVAMALFEAVKDNGVNNNYLERLETSNICICVTLTSVNMGRLLNPMFNSQENVKIYIFKVGTMACWLRVTTGPHGRRATVEILNGECPEDADIEWWTAILQDDASIGFTVFNGNLYPVGIGYQHGLHWQDREKFLDLMGTLCICNN